MSFGTKEESAASKEATNVKIAEFIKSDKYYGPILGKVPSGFVNTFYKVFSGVKSKSTALKAKCIDCSNYNRAEITECEVKHCPLWNFRPYQK